MDPTLASNPRRRSMRDLPSRTSGFKGLPPAFQKRLPVGIANLLLAKSEVRAAIGGLRGMVDAPAAPPDAMTPAEIPSCSSGRTADRVLAEIDQDGFLFAADPADVVLFNRRERKLSRVRYRMEVVLLSGGVCVRKQFRLWHAVGSVRERVWGAAGLPFYTEAAALLRLRGIRGIPQVRRIDCSARTIWMDYIRGESLRHLAAAAGDAVHDLDLADDDALAALSMDDRDRREMALFSRLADPTARRELKQLATEILGRGVAPQDVKLGNVLVGERTESHYWIDFERAGLQSSPVWQERVTGYQNLMRDWFGIIL